MSEKKKMKRMEAAGARSSGLEEWALMRAHIEDMHADGIDCSDDGKPVVAHATVAFAAEGVTEGHVYDIGVTEVLLHGVLYEGMTLEELDVAVREASPKRWRKAVREHESNVDQREARAAEAVTA